MTSPNKPGRAELHDEEGGRNQLWLDAQLIALEPSRRTPAGVPVTACQLRHESSQVEAGQPRQVAFEIQAVAIGGLASVLAAAMPGAKVRVAGFLSARSLRSRQPVLHLNEIEFLEGSNNGFQVQVQVQEEEG